MTSDLLAQLPKSAFKKAYDGKFAPTLSFGERCAILAFVRSGVSRPIVAAAFSVDRRTVGHVCNDAGPHYKDVRREYTKLGHEDFVKTYLREGLVSRVAAAARTSEAQAPNDDYKEQRGDISPRANRKAGTHTVKPDQCTYSHRVEIQFLKDGVPGWYYRDMDSATPDAWLHNGDDSRKTSQACYDALLLNIVDDLPPKEG